MSTQLLKFILSQNAEIQLFILFALSAYSQYKSRKQPRRIEFAATQTKPACAGFSFEIWS